MKFMLRVRHVAQALELFAAPMLLAGILVFFVMPTLRQLFGEDALPQVVRGDGALAVAFGDARAVLGRAMVERANIYMHGGVDLDCHALHDGRHELHHHDVGCDCAKCRHEHEEHEHGGSSEPWAWINEHVMAPRVHRHLDGKKSVELIPWLWASVKADPHNIDTWTTAAYVAGDMMKDQSLALRILEEGKAGNPSSVRLRYFEGRARYAGGTGDVAAAKTAFESARDLAVEEGLSSLSDEEFMAYEFSTNFIADIERQEAGE